MTNIEFVNKAREIERLNTLYVNGCFGAKMTPENKRRYMVNTAYNRQPARSEKIRIASEDTYGFDCVNLIKAIIWGFPNVKYASNGLPDIGEDKLIKQCSPSSNFNVDIPKGVILWMEGHVGIYVGDGLCIEATPSGSDGVQVSAVANIKYNPKYKLNRTWKKWGRLPFLIYEDDEMVKDIIVIYDNTEVKLKAIVKDGTNYIRLRDIDEVLGIAKVDWDVKKKIPTIEKK